MITKIPRIGPLPPEALRDQFRPPIPPEHPVKVTCMHCGKSYMSDKIYWIDDLQSIIPGGGWVCPTQVCEGAGFKYDIWPDEPGLVDWD